MPKTYYDSELTAEQIEDALTAIDGVVNPGNNGKVLYIENGQIKAASASRWSGGAVLEPLSVTANGDYTPPTGTDGFNSVHVAVPGAGNIQPLSVTENGTYNPPSGVDGYAPVTVNVSGGLSKIELFPNGVSFYSQLNMTSISGGKNESDNWNILVNANPAPGYDNFVLKMASGDFSDKSIAVAFDLQFGENTVFLTGYDIGYRLSNVPQTSFTDNFRNNLKRNKNLQHSADIIASSSSATDIYINFNLSALDNVATTISITNMRAYILN